ncbi:hypothetical protein CHUAL_013284 [Chamberlinius hualienensis]
MNFANVVKLLLVHILMTFTCGGLTEDKLHFQRKPKMIFIVMRHGARAPSLLIPGDSNNNLWLTVGLTELTNLGIRQQITNGKLSRQMYNDFLGSRYNSSTFYIQSSNFNRCVTSGQAFSTGLFPPSENQIWTTGCLGNLWKPIPVFTTNIANSENLLLIFKQQLSRIYSNSDLYDKYKPLIDAIAKATGVPVNNSTMLSIVLFADTLVCEIYEELPLPHGLSAYKQQLISFRNEAFDFVVTNSKPEIPAILLNDMVNRIQAFNSGSSLIKMSIYSLSDIHVATLMAAVSNVTVGAPPFAASIYFELYAADDTSNSDYLIVRYRPRIEAELKTYFIKDCGYQCQYDQFIDLVNHINIAAKSSI